ncbi:MAG: VOC family protein [Candidatus Saccharimonadales bacterium]
MKLVSISGLVFVVKDIGKTASFYEDLGFRITLKDEDHLTMRLNWFFVEFYIQSSEHAPQEQRDLDNTNSGAYIYIKVDSTSEYYDDLVKRGIGSVEKPTRTNRGKMELIITDPDGYKLVLFE